MIAQSLSCDPQLLIADEPTTALDVTVQAEILELMRDLRKRLDSAIILITHDMGVVADLADHIMVMKNGVVVESGTVDADLQRTRSTRTRSSCSPRCRTSGRVPRRSTRAVADERRPRSPDRRDREPTEAARTSVARVLEDVVDRVPQARSRARLPRRRRARRPARSSPARSSASSASRLGQDDDRPRGRRAAARSPRARCDVVGQDMVGASTEGPASRCARKRRHRLPGPGLVAEPAPARSASRSASRCCSPGRPRARTLDKRVEDAARPGRAAARVSATATRTSCRAVSASASASPARSRSSPSCWSPTSRPRALDVSVQATVLDLFQDLQREQRLRLPVHQPRPRRRRDPRRPDRGDAPRQARRAGHDASRSSATRRTRTRSD